MKCQKCGNEISPSDKFCTNCGEKVETVRYCQSCGEALTGRFCTNCGADSQESAAPAAESPPVVYQAPPAITVVQAEPEPSKYQMRCPICGGTKIQVIDAAPAGIQTSRNINPFQPFTYVNVKKARKRVSGAKVAAALFTGGVSMLFTGGVHSKVGVEVFCLQCGHTWEVKR